jgi:PIN domain nuclease of toxin-antitoxin system
VNLLLDTNALLWLAQDNARLGSKARSAIASATTIAFSEVSLFEISIKVSAGKLPEIAGLHEFLRTSGMQRSGIPDSYLARLEALPRIHGDPFDRLLIAQALTDNLAVVTSDEVFARYGVRVIDAQA